MLILTPVVRAYTVVIKLHQSTCTEQIMLICPCAAAPNEILANAMPRASFFILDQKSN